MSLLGIVLLVILIVLMIGTHPGWPHAGLGYGYYPSGGAAFVLLILLLLILFGRL